MKKKIFFCVTLVVIVTTISFLAKSQSSSGGSNNTISLDDFDMSPLGIGYSTLNTLLLGESAFLSKFGAPLSNSTYYSEVEETNMNNYVYSGAEASFINDILQSLSFTTPDYSLVMSNGSSIKVGDNILTVANMFSASWANRTSNQVFVSLQNWQGPIDMTILFEYDPGLDIITSISIQQ